MPDATGAPTATPPAQFPDPIIIGETLPGAAPETYVVESGDTLFAIAERLGVDPEEIIRLNDLADPSNLEVGQVLKIPGAPAALPTGPAPLPGEPLPESTPAPPVVPTGEDTYTVQSGDNASTIADACGFTLDELAAANGTTIEGLRSLEVGQVLNLPGPCVAPVPAPEEPEVAPPPEGETPEVVPPPEAPTPEVAPETPELPPEGVEPAPEAPTPESAP